MDPTFGLFGKLFPDMTLARAIQIIFRLLMILLTGKAGMDAQTATSLAQPASELAGVGGLFLVDLVIHSARFGQFVTTIKSLTAGLSVFDEAEAPAATVPPATAAPSTTGKVTVAGTVGRLLLVMASMALLGAMCGCAENETNRAAQGIILTTTHEQTALWLHNSHLTTPSDETTINTLLKAENAAIHAYYAAIKNGDAEALATAKAALAAATSAASAEFANFPPMPQTTQPAN